MNTEIAKKRQDSAHLGIKILEDIYQTFKLNGAPEDPEEDGGT